MGWVDTLVEWVGVMDGWMDGSDADGWVHGMSVWMGGDGMGKYMMGCMDGMGWDGHPISYWVCDHGWMNDGLVA